MSSSSERKAAAFSDLLIAAMLDAVCEGKNTQLLTHIKSPVSGELELVRIIVVPEKMPMEFPGGLESHE